MSARILGSLVTAAAVLLATAGPVAAREVAVKDARGDVWASTAPDTWEPAPAGSLGDVTRAVVRHEASKVVVTVRFADLRRTGSYAQYAVRIQGSRDKVVREVVVEAGARGWDGRHRVFRADGEPATGCSATHLIDYQDEKVQVRVDPGCLRSPGSVRVNVNAYRAQKDKTFLADNPHNEKAESSAWSPWARRTG